MPTEYFNFFNPKIFIAPFHNFDECRTLNPKRVVKNGPATVVFWFDGTKTVVKKCEDDSDDVDDAIMWALAKKEFRTTSAAHHFLDRIGKRLYIGWYAAFYMYFLGKFDNDIEKFNKYLDSFRDLVEEH